MSRILVTGGAGFIGSHLCKSLLEKGEEVICVDNFFTGRRKNVEELMKNPKFKLFPFDINNTFKGNLLNGMDEIYNLACPASPPHYQSDSIETIKTSTIGVINVLEFARLNGAKILQASTSEAYGDPLEHPQKETYRGNVNTIGPRACYDEGKRVSETLFADYRRRYRMTTKIIRIFNTYGPNMNTNDGRAICNFIIQAIKDEDITIYGDGKQTRSFCYVDDLVEGIIKRMSSNYSGIVNLGNPQERTILELAEKIIEVTGSKSKIVFKQLPEDDPTRRCPDISLAKEILNWQPKVDFQEGLNKTIEYFREEIKSEENSLPFNRTPD